MGILQDPCWRAVGLHIRGLDGVHQYDMVYGQRTTGSNGGD